MTTCPTCGIRFLPTELNATFCSPACWPQVQSERAAGCFRRAAARPQRRTRSERFAVLNNFVDGAMATLTGAEVKVWLVLFRDTKSNGLACTGQVDIARRAGLSIRAVQKTIRRLEAAGLLRVVRRGRLNAGPSIYRVLA